MALSAPLADDRKRKVIYISMEKFEVTILGCGSATPTLRHNPSAQVVNMRDKLSLVDCGEGTQLQMRLRKIKFMALRNVFVSHLHGDHCLGLVGLISTFGLLGRTKAFHGFAKCAQCADGTVLP